MRDLSPIYTALGYEGLAFLYKAWGYEGLYPYMTHGVMGECQKKQKSIKKTKKYEKRMVTYIRWCLWIAFRLRAFAQSTLALKLFKFYKLRTHCNTHADSSDLSQCRAGIKFHMLNMRCKIICACSPC
jgi:hypothetical protein